MASDMGSYLIRSLLSEGRVRYVTVEKTRDGLKSKTIDREGPTGLIVTTTNIALHPENETRMLSITVTDTREQTEAIMMSQAEAALAGNQIDRVGPNAAWLALQIWTAAGGAAVVIPFAVAIAQMVPATAVRLRRDFPTLMSLIKAHAILHQASRDKHEHGHIIAIVDDYAVVRELVADLMAHGVGAMVKPETREVVETVRRLMKDCKDEVRQSDLVSRLKLDKSAVSRRVKGALADGFLKNNEEKRGKPARLVVGDPLPDDVAFLPTADQVLERLHGCTVDRGDHTLPSSTNEGDPLANESDHSSVSPAATAQPRNRQSVPAQIGLMPGEEMEL